MAPRLLPLCFTAMLALGCVAGEPAVETRTEAIVNGSLTTGDEAVVALTVNGQQFCTGTLVTPTTVVTAAHCLPPHVQMDVSDIEVVFGSDVAAPLETVGVADGLANPAWSTSLIANDVGVLKLNRAVSVQPIPMLAQPLDWINPVGTSVRMIGFGITSADGSGNGRKRVGDMEITAVDDSTIYLAPGPASTCSGDSGGPLLISFFGIEFIAGIHSRSNCEDMSINERVDIHAQDFILSFIEGHGTPADCAADGLCASDCDDIDPDCPCAADGFCTSECMALEADPDCSGECGADGVCSDSCGRADPDCDGSPGFEAGCQAGGSAGGSALGLWLLLGLLMARRRRR